MACSASDFSRRYPSMDTCQMRLTQTCLNSFAAPQNSTSDTRDEACAAQLPQEACTDFLAAIVSGACLPSPGPRADGQGCAFAGQCASAFCTTPDSSNCGVCAAEPKPLDPCGDCGTHGLVCDNGMCVQPLGSGATCMRMGPPCASGFTCVAGGMGAMGSCQAQLTTVGATCDNRGRTAADCSRDAGLYCNMGTCAATVMAADGATCGQVNGVLTQCASGGCFGATGMTPGTCKVPAADGMPCDTINGPGCQAPARCVGASSDGGATGTCQLAGATTC